MALDFSRPGKPTDNAYIDAFNGRFRAECLNLHWFLTLADAHEKMEDWRRYYNLHHNTHLSMSLMEREVVDRDAARGVFCRALHSLANLVRR